MTLSDDAERRILEKAEYVQESIEILANKRELDEEDYRSDREQRAIVEREFQTAIEACLDIASIVIRTSATEMPETYAERFGVLADIGVLSKETATRMQRAAGFRNILVHQYGDEIDNTKVYEHLQTELSWLVRYLHEVRDWLE